MVLQFSESFWLENYVDLHLHSSFSDGTFSVEKLVDCLYENKIYVFSLTDHDSTAGHQLAADCAKKYAMQFVPGLEISAHDQVGALHVLGYFIDANDACLQQKLLKIREARTQRNRLILEKLQTFNIFISEAELQASFPVGTVIGRPHIAQLLLAKGVVSNINQAFAQYLGAQGKSYFDKETLLPSEAIALIKNAGGWAFLAHPVSLKRSVTQLKKLLHELKAAGLDGVEVYNSAHKHDHIRLYRQIAEECSLLISGGSDFHGTNKPYVKIGEAMQGKKIYGKQISKEFFDKLTFLSSLG